MRKATGGVPAEGQSVLMDPRGFQIKSDGSVNQDSPGVPSLVLCLSLCLSLCLRRGPPPMSRPTISGFVTHGKLWFWSRKLHIIRDIHCQVASYEKNADLKDLQCDINVTSTPATAGRVVTFHPPHLVSPFVVCVFYFSVTVQQWASHAVRLGVYSCLTTLSVMVFAEV